MANQKVFLRWWLVFSLIVLSAIVCGRFGLFGEVWDKDASKLSFLIIALFAAMTVWCGVSTWAVSRNLINGEVDKELLSRIECTENCGWFVSDVLLTIGMIGTVLGFILMLAGSFGNLSPDDTAALKLMLTNLSVGMSTALYTTLVGLIGSVLLKIQLFNLTHILDEIRRGDSMLVSEDKVR